MGQGWELGGKILERSGGSGWQWRNFKEKLLEIALGLTTLLKKKKRLSFLKVLSGPATFAMSGSGGASVTFRFHKHTLTHAHTHTSTRTLLSLEGMLQLRGKVKKARQGTRKLPPLPLPSIFSGCCPIPNIHTYSFFFPSS